MKLDFDKFPTIKNLADDVREKALEYAASLGARGPRPTTVLGTAVTLAREWKSGRLPARPLAAPFLVQPRQGRWVIKRSNESEPSHTFLKKDDAVRRAQELAAAAGAACFVFGPGGMLIERYEAKALKVLVAAPEPEPALALEPEPALAPEPAPLAEVKCDIRVPDPEVPEVLPEIVEAPPVLDSAVAPVANSDDEELPSENPSGEAPIRVKKLAGKWALILGDGRIEIHGSRNKTLQRARALAKQLGRAVVLA